MIEPSLKQRLNALLHSGNIPLISSQVKLSYPVIERLYKKMAIGLKSFEPIKVHEKLIIDGHHRYIASLLAGYEIEKIPSLRTSVKKEEAWELTEFYNYDWYSPEKIKDWNELDAKELGLTYEDLLERIK